PDQLEFIGTAAPLTEAAEVRSGRPAGAVPVLPSAVACRSPRAPGVRSRTLAEVPELTARMSGLPLRMDRLGQTLPYPRVRQALPAEDVARLRVRPLAPLAGAAS